MKPEPSDILRHGLVAGVAGYGGVVIFYAVWNVLLGRSPFHTAALLGETMFFGLTDPRGVTVRAPSVLAFNGVHMLAFLVVGTLCAWLATFAERGAQFWYIVLSLFVYGLIHAIGILLWIAEPLRDQLPAWTVVAATTLALAVMAAYLFKVHPRIQREMIADDDAL